MGKLEFARFVFDVHFLYPILHPLHCLSYMEQPVHTVSAVSVNTEMTFRQSGSDFIRHQ